MARRMGQSTSSDLRPYGSFHPTEKRCLRPSFALFCMAEGAPWASTVCLEVPEVRGPSRSFTARAFGVRPQANPEAYLHATTGLNEISVLSKCRFRAQSRDEAGLSHGAGGVHELGSNATRLETPQREIRLPAVQGDG